VLIGPVLRGPRLLTDVTPLIVRSTIS
jgi:hypothetical protein